MDGNGIIFLFVCVCVRVWIFYIMLSYIIIDGLHSKFPEND